MSHTTKDTYLLLSVFKIVNSSLSEIFLRSQPVKQEVHLSLIILPIWWCKVFNIDLHHLLSKKLFTFTLGTNYEIQLQLNVGKIPTQKYVPEKVEINCLLGARAQWRLEAPLVWGAGRASTQCQPCLPWQVPPHRVVVMEVFFHGKLMIFFCK